MPSPPPSKTLDAQTRAALAARLRFYRELGVYDFYRREPSAELLAQLEAAESPAPTIESETELPKAKPAKSPATTDRCAALALIREDIGECTRCKLHEQGRKQIVFGVGNVNADIMFVGEGPGADEDEQGEPFVGRAGQLLNNMISAMGIKREDVYIANVVKCRPPQNRTPERDECETCSPFLMRQIATVRPKVIVALGAVAAKNLLGINDAMANLRGHLYDFHPIVPKSAPEYDPDFTTKLAVTYHPAYLLRDPRQKKEAWKDLQMVMKYLGMPTPAKSASE
ncbi:MAG TPA: uracil-DNA glycosylase [Clostridia bacterium]|nr:uracil-DNA glycosylase [Clostridia bacterium]